MIATVRIDAIAAGGDGVGRSDGLVVFVPRTAPGDVVTADVEPRRGFARSLALDVVYASPERVDPPCQHYTRDACGGCQIQHLAYSAQLAAKQRIVRDALQRIGKRDVPLPFIRPSPDEWRYRSKLTLAMRRRGQRWIAGLHRFDEPSRVFALADCPITRREIVRVWHDVLNASADLPDHGELRGSVQATGDGFTFTLSGGREWKTHQEFFAAVGDISALWWKPDGAAARCLHARPGVHGAEVGASFAQINPAVAAELQKHVIERALAYTPGHVLDAYAGTGATALPLAACGARVTAIEMDQHAATALARRQRPPSRTVIGRVEDHIVSALPADVVLLNPPRVGVAAAVATALESAAPRPDAILYVSCNPATLARDLRRMPGYGVESLVAFDMFPQTAHVETVCELVPGGA